MHDVGARAGQAACRMTRAGQAACRMALALVCIEPAVPRRRSASGALARGGCNADDIESPCRLDCRLGIASQHGGHGEDILAGAAVGAIVGALVGKATSGHKYAFAFYIQRLDGRETKIISEQPGLQIGDCVTIEEGKHTSIRRVSQANCDPGYKQHRGDEEVVAHHQYNADACASAKNDLLNAEADDDLSKLAYKVEVICSH